MAWRRRRAASCVLLDAAAGHWARCLDARAGDGRGASSILAAFACHVNRMSDKSRSARSAASRRRRMSAPAALPSCRRAKQNRHVTYVLTVGDYCESRKKQRETTTLLDLTGAFRYFRFSPFSIGSWPGAMDFSWSNEQREWY